MRFAALLLLATVVTNPVNGNLVGGYTDWAMLAEDSDDYKTFSSK
jgi:hypothetical protein